MFTLGRGIDMYYPTNGLILALTALSSILGLYMFGNLGTGFLMAGIVFLTWALGRETDPKREYTAFAGVIIAFLFIFLSDSVMIHFLELLFVILLLRLINSSSGAQPTLLDSGIILGLSAYISYSQENYLYLILFFIGLSFSQVFKEKKILKYLSTLLAIISVGILIYLFFTQAAFSSPILSPISLIALLALYLLTVYLDREKKIYDDANHLIDSNSVLFSQFVYGLIILSFTFLTDPVIGNMIVYLSSIAGAIIYRPISRYFHIED